MIPINNSDLAWLVVSDYNQDNNIGFPEDLREDVYNPDVSDWYHIKFGGIFEIYDYSKQAGSGHYLGVGSGGFSRTTTDDGGSVGYADRSVVGAGSVYIGWNNGVGDCYDTHRQ